MSNIEGKVGELLKEAFPTHNLVSQKVVKFANAVLKFDYYLPELKVLVEVQGQQHYTFNKFFHNSHQDLEMQKFRDTLKTQYAAENKLGLILIKFDEVSKLDVHTIKKMVLSYL